MTKIYTLWVTRYNIYVKIPSNNKHNAIEAIKHKLALTWQDDIRVIGINL